MKLTIAIPTFNGGKNLERAIRSCGNIQLSTDDYEILVIDNFTDFLFQNFTNNFAISRPT